ncbi:hypothetical protein ACQR3P_29490 [Rhodococcus sp. IEGM1300]
MPAPNTGGVLRSHISQMKVGDYIVWKSNGSAYIMDGSTEGYTERPVLGASDTAMPYAGTHWYGIKVDKGLIVADRVIQNTVSWNQLNTSGIIEGKSLTLLDGTNGILRSLGGGNSYSDGAGNMKTSDEGYGAWPTNNEWDTYITNKDYGTGVGRDDVWHWNGVGTHCQETIGRWYENVSTNRVKRGSTSVDGLLGAPSTGVDAGSGFRPVFEYKEVIA